MEFEKEVKTIDDIKQAVFDTIDATIKNMQTQAIYRSDIEFEYRGFKVVVKLEELS